MTYYPPDCQGLYYCSPNDKIDAFTLDKLEKGFDALKQEEYISLLQKYLTTDIFDKLKHKRTPYGSNFYDCIQSGVELLNSRIGLYAPDPDAYSVYADIFDPIIKHLHDFHRIRFHPLTDYGDQTYFVDLDPYRKYIISTRIRCNRTIANYPMQPQLKDCQYQEMEKTVVFALASLTGDLKGKYWPLFGMARSTQAKLIAQKCLYEENDEFLEAGQATRLWPVGRGIHYNEARTFFVWTNEEDHLKVISMEYYGDLGSVYRRFVNAMVKLEQLLPFVCDIRLGYINLCPSNIGTALRASVQIKLPKLAKKKNQLRFQAMAALFNLTVKDLRVQGTPRKRAVFEISNQQVIGLTEFEAVKSLQDGVLALIHLEEIINRRKKQPPRPGPYVPTCWEKFCQYCPDDYGY